MAIPAAERILSAKYHICDMCGARVERNMLRYVLKMDIFAAYDTMQISFKDLSRDYEEEIRRLVEDIKNMDPKQLEEDVSKQLSFDLCRKCHQKFLKNPLGNGAGGEDASFPPFDVDDFLRQINRD